MASQRRKALDNQQTDDMVSPEPTKEMGKQTVSFTAVAIQRETMPQPGKRGGRASNVPAIEGFLDSLNAPGTFEMRSPDEDGGHPVNRIAQIRKAAETHSYKVETAPIQSGKRYRVFITVPESDGATATA